ncbi:MAG: phage holin family protein [Caldilineaceae bacterium]
MQSDIAPGNVVSVNDEPTLGDLFSSLTEDMSTLIRKEVDLARTETMEKVSSATRSVVSMVAGGMLAYAGLIGVMIAVIVGLSRFMALWLSALIVGIVVIIIGGIMIMSGRSSLQKLSVVPEQTVESIKENAEWAKEQVQ